MRVEARPQTTAYKSHVDADIAVAANKRLAAATEMDRNSEI